MLDALQALNKMREDAYHDPEIDTRIQQYEMAYRMQIVRARADRPLQRARKHLRLSTAKTPADLAPTPPTACLPAASSNAASASSSSTTGLGPAQQPAPRPRPAMQGQRPGASALVQDLKQRGMLDDTLVVWGGEFGRTVYCQGKLTETDYGRDHHPRNFCMWMAGGGVKRGFQLGETDDYSYNITSDPVHVHDVQATLLHCLGVDHTRLTYKFQGRWFRLTDVHGNVVRSLLA